MNMSNYKYKQVIVVRKDLKMRTGKCVAQGAHASLAAVIHNQNHPDVIAWLNSRFVKICVYVNSEDELNELCRLAKIQGIVHSPVIIDAGFTEFKGVPTATCVAIGPGLVEDIDKITGNLPLL